jgi:glutamyl-tRNA synthetase
VLELTIKCLSSLLTFGHEDIENAFKSLMEECGLKFGKIGPTVRVALVGGTVSPSIYDVVSVLGKEEVLGRLKKALASID